MKRIMNWIWDAHLSVRSTLISHELLVMARAPDQILARADISRIALRDHQKMDGTLTKGSSVILGLQADQS